MYWSRTGSYLDLAQWLLISLLAWAGGWLLCRALFRTHPRERVFLGIACGLLLQTLTANLLGLLLPLKLALWSSALVVFFAGLVVAWWVRPRLPFTQAEFTNWQHYLLFAGLLLLFAGINRGLALFDDYSNLPLVSIIATGDFPPHFYLNPTQILSYHYGLHLLAAGLAGIGGFFPWSAWDLYKALSISLTVILGMLWFRRFMGWRAVVLLAGSLILFAGGARWLLLFIPAPILETISSKITLIGSGIANSPDLFAGLTGPWNAQGEGPLPFPFAFVNGIFQPLIMAMGSSGAIPSMTLFLLFLIAQRRWKPLNGLVFGLLVASLSLFAETMFIIVLGGIASAMLIRWWASRRLKPAMSWAWTLLPGALLVPLWGGVLARPLQNLFGTGAAAENAVQLTLPGIALRWPPAILSAHLGELYLSIPGSLLVALAEMGPVLLMAPIAIWAVCAYIRSGKLLMAGTSLMTIPGFLLPLFLRFLERDRDITRLIGSSLGIWLIIAIPYLWLAFQGKKKWVSGSIIAFCLTAVFGGIVLFSFQIISITQTQPSYFIGEIDARMSKEFWNKLEPEAWVLDPNHPYRPAALFGRTTGPAFQNVYIPRPDFLELVHQLDPVAIANAGYSYLYLDRKTWQNLSSQQRGSIEEKCSRLISEKKSELGDFRRLYNISLCRTSP